MNKAVYRFIRPLYDKCGNIGTLIPGNCDMWATWEGNGLLRHNIEMRLRCGGHVSIKRAYACLVFRDLNLENVP